MATIPHGSPAVPTLARRILDPALILAAIGFMAYGAFWPIFGTLPGRDAGASPSWPRVHRRRRV